MDLATSGLLVVAKTKIMAAKCNKLWMERKVTKEYLALVYGHVDTSTDRSFVEDADADADRDRDKKKEGKVIPRIITEKSRKDGEEEKQMIIDTWIRPSLTDSRQMEVVPFFLSPDKQEKEGRKKKKEDAILVDAKDLQCIGNMKRAITYGRVLERGYYKVEGPNYNKPISLVALTPHTGT